MASCGFLKFREFSFQSRPRSTQQAASCQHGRYGEVSAGQAGGLRLQDPAAPVRQGLQGRGLEPLQPGLDREAQDYGGQQEGGGLLLTIICIIIVLDMIQLYTANSYSL